MHILITGVAGFIGFHVSRRLLSSGHSVVGLDNLNDYYAVELKKDRLAQLEDTEGFRFVTMDLSDAAGVAGLFEREGFSHVINLGAQAGVQYSLKNPGSYVDSNVSGFLHILEGCRHHRVRHLIYASSSSVYGLNTHMPFRTDQPTEHPISLYAATKKANEMMAHAYSHLYGIPCTGLRFFTVYGPWGRPDMAIFIFTRAILEGRTIDVFDYGKARRSFTYVDDVVEGVARLLDRAPEPDPGWSAGAPEPDSSSAPYRIYNIGNDETVELEHLISLLEQALGKPAVKNYLPPRPGDMPGTFADIQALERDVGFRPSTPLNVGIERFVDWYRAYYRV